MLTHLRWGGSSDKVAKSVNIIPERFEDNMFLEYVFSTCISTLVNFNADQFISRRHYPLYSQVYKATSNIHIIIYL